MFVNCCHLAATERAQLLRGETNECAPSYDRAQFAASVAEELIRIGVRCVIAAGWAVDDRAAMSFATTFYDALLRGARFIDAVAQARDAAREHGGNTWAAYQCYGDPDWRFEREGADAQHPSRPLADEFAIVASPPALALALETLAVQSKYLRTKEETEDLRAKIRHLEARFEVSWGSIGAVAEAFGVAWTAARDVARAILWYERALEANDGSASLKAAEQLGNLRVRSAWESVAGLLNDGGAALRDALPAARSTIEAALEALERIVAVAPSIERESLCGSACKRLAMVHAQAGDTQAEQEALARMQMHYERAEQKAREQNHPERYYPALNRMAVELTVNAGRRGWQGFDADALEAVRQSLVDRARDDPDFWSVVSLIELRVYEALARGELGTRSGSIANDYDDLHARVTASWMWSSVADQAQFVLPKVAAHAPPAEKKAALALLERLQRFAQG